MNSSAVFATLLFAAVTYSANTLSAADDYYAAYSIDRVMGDSPVRNVVVKRSGPEFTSYRAFQFDCASQDFRQTGFFSSPEGALAELARTTRSDSYYSSLIDTARVKACELEPGMNVSDTAQPPSAS